MNYKKVLLFLSCLVMAHFFFYVVTGLALWAPINAERDVDRVLGMVVLHVLACIRIIYYLVKGE